MEQKKRQSAGNGAEEFVQPYKKGLITKKVSNKPPIFFLYKCAKSRPKNKKEEETAMKNKQFNHLKEEAEKNRRKTRAWRARKSFHI